ncbi:MAG: bile acid:sodium symporter, partial [Dokdonella sp.]
MPVHALRSVLDPFVLALFAVIALAIVVPARGAAVGVLDIGTTIAIATLFFLHGARLSREAIVAGIVHWRLHLLVLALTFAVFPLLGLLLWPLAQVVLSPDLAIGILFLCALPSTVQSSIAFTAIARGNVAAAVCSASLSNVLGVVMTPLLVSLMLSTHGGIDARLESIARIVLQLLAPFLIGHLLR